MEMEMVMRIEMEMGIVLFSVKKHGGNWSDYILRRLNIFVVFMCCV